MAEDDAQLSTFLDARKPGAHLSEAYVPDDFVLLLGVDLVNYPKFPKAVEPGVTFRRTTMDIRQDVDVDSGAELDDYSGPYRPDLRFTDFSAAALAGRIIPWSEAYLLVCIEGWVKEVSRRFGEEAMREIEWAAWSEQIAPELARMRTEFLPASVPPYDDPNDGSAPVVYTGVFSPSPVLDGLSKAELVRWLLGSHEYLLQCIEGWAAQIVVRHGLDEMFDIQYTLWGETVLPQVKVLKASYLGISGDTVEDWMKDLQMDATALPGKAFDLTFEMPSPDVGVMTFNRCVAVDQWEGMGRPDILEKNCHSTCPKSMIVTTKMYNPRMKVDILAIPPRVDDGDVCCRWRFSMDDEPVAFGPKPA